jgi:hypothetical protein
MDGTRAEIVHGRPPAGAFAWNQRRIAAVVRSVRPGIPAGDRRLEALMMIAMTMLLATLVAGGSDVKGKWDGKVTSQRDDGTTAEDTVLLILDQKDTAVTGTVGGSETDQHPITSGSIEGNAVKIVARHTENGREYQIELTVENDEMKGSVKSGTRSGQLQLKRRKE